MSKRRPDDTAAAEGGAAGGAITLVVPTYQEADNIGAFLRAARAALPDARIIACDDSSPDRTGAIAEEGGLELGNVAVLHRPSKRGLGNAYRHGFRAALDGGTDVVVQMDVDFSHPPDLLPGMLESVRAGADVVIGSRYVAGGGTPDWPLHRRLLSRYGNLYARRMLRLAVGDATSGMRVYRAACLRRIRVEDTRANGFGFMLETMRRLSVAPLRIQEVPLVFRDRVAGASKMSVRIMIETLQLVSGWGLAIRYPRLARALGASPPGRALRHLVARLA